MSKSQDVPIKGEAGQDLGFTITLAQGDGPTVDRVTGWSKFQVDGEPYPFSKAKAAALLSRFPYMAAQLDAADKKDASK